MKKTCTIKIVTVGGPALPRVLHAVKIEPATLRPGYIILDECRTVALEDVVAIVPDSVPVPD